MPYQFINSKKEKLHKRGNFIAAQLIIDSYSNNQFATILLGACNKDGQKIKARDIPVFYPVTILETEGLEGKTKRTKIKVSLPGIGELW